MAKFSIILLLYFGIQTISFGLFKSGGDIDTAELLVHIQSWELGYGGSQPPMYNWLALGLTEVFGLNLLTLSALKFLMLAVTFLAVLFSARDLGFAPRAAAAASFGLFAIPEISWEAQRALSHSASMLAFCALGFWIVVRMGKHAMTGPAAYGLLGLVMAAAVLSKYNAIVFFSALFLACWLVPAFGHVVRTRKLAITFAVAAPLLAPHLIWALANSGAVFQRVRIFGMGEGSGWLGARLEGLGGLLLANLLTGGLLLLVALFSLWRSAGPAWRLKLPPSQRGNLALAVFLIGNGVALAVILITGTTEVQNRWLLPILPLLPLALVAMMGDTPQATSMPDKRKFGLASAILGLGASVAVVGLVAVPLSIQFPIKWSPARDLLDYPALYEEILTGSPVPPAAIVTTYYGVFANLRLVQPELRIVNPISAQPAELVAEPMILIWSGKVNPPQPLLEFAAELGYAPVPQPVQSWALPRLDRADITLPVHFVALRRIN